MRLLLCSDIHDDFEWFPVNGFPTADLYQQLYRAAGQSEISMHRGVTTVYNVARRWQLIDID